MSSQKNLRKGEHNPSQPTETDMNLLVEDPLSKTGFSGPFVLFPGDSGLQTSAKEPSARIPRVAMEAFLNATSNSAHNGHFFVPPPERANAKPDKELALGVLKQAAHDLRRFRSATRGVRRELYVDAHDWVTANDFSWTYSFVNICKTLNVCPEVVRTELFADASLSWFDYWAKRAGEVSQRLQSSFVRIFAGCPDSESAIPTH
jgi:hypothetical protein